MRLEPAGQQTASIRQQPCAARTPEEFDEERLVEQAQQGSHDAFRRLVECYEARIFRLAKRIAHSREDAEEIMQDAFVQAHKNLSRFRRDSRFYTWLVRITINAGLMKLRRRRHKERSIDNRIHEGPLSSGPEDWGPNPEQRYSQTELHCILERTIAQLPPEYRTVFQLRDVEGFSTQETAQALTLSQAAVKSRVRRARTQLRKLLNPYFKPNQASRAGSARVFSSVQPLLAHRATAGMVSLAANANMAFSKMAISGRS